LTPSNWVLDNAPNVRPALYAVAFPSAIDGWLAGDGGLLYRWDGRKFQQLSLGSGPSIRHLWASGPTDVWGAGLAGALVHFDGQQWQPVASPFRGDILAIAGAGPDDVWALERGNDTAYLPVDPHGFTIAYVYNNRLWHWSGGTWSQQPLSYPSSLAVVGPGDVWVGATTADYRALFFHWDGSSWANQRVEEIGVVSSLAAVAANEVWAVITDDSNRPASMIDTTYFTLYRFDGNSWSAEPYPDPSSDGSKVSRKGAAHGGNAALTSVTALHGTLWLRDSFDKRGTYWEAGQTALFRRDRNQWNRVLTFTADDSWTLASCCSLPADRDWTATELDGAAADDVWINGLDGQLFHWNGTRVESLRTWKPTPIGAIWTAPSGSVWAVGNLGTVLRRSESGWSAATAEFEDSFTWITGTSDDDVWAGGASTIHWDGKAWSRFPYQATCGLAVAPNEAFVGTLQGLWHVTDGQWNRELPDESWILSLAGTSSDLWVVTYDLSDDAHLYHFDRQWQRVSRPSPFVARVQITPRGDVFAYGTLADVYVREGQGWQLVTSNRQLSGDRVWARSPTDIWARGYNGLLHFDGSAWAPEGPNVDRGIYVDSGGTVWAFGSSGAIYRMQP
jgi:hypothetical protein